MEEIEVVETGWHPLIWLSIAAGVVALVMFIAVKYGKWDWRKAISKDAFHWIKLIGYALAILEILVLSENAMQRGVTPMAAYGRYTGVALIAIVFGFLLGSAFEQGIENKYKDDGIITLKELSLVLLPTFIIFICTIIVANATFMLYLESIGKMEMLVKRVSLIDMIYGVEFESDPNKFVYAKEKDVQVENSAWILTYADVFINLSTILYAIFVEHWKKIYVFHPCNRMGALMEKLRGTSVVLENAKQLYFEQQMVVERLRVETQAKAVKFNKELDEYRAKNGVTTKDAKDDKSNKDKKDYFKGNNAEIKYYYPMLKDVFGITESDFETFLNERCGYDPVTGNKKVYADTMPDVKDGKMEPDVARDKTINALINNDGQLRALSEKFKAVEDFLSDKLFPEKVIIDGLVKKNANDPEIAVRKKDLTIKLNEFKSDVLPKYAKAWDKTYNYLKNTIRVKLPALEEAKVAEKYKCKPQIQELEDACK